MVTFQEFRQAFAKAEEDIKYAELSIGGIESIESEDCVSGANPRGIVVPSINELRYAAKHISDALVEGISDKDRETQIDKAIRHCVRARLDALRATIIFLSQHFHHFSQDYSLSNLPDRVRNRQNEIREKIVIVLKSISQIQTHNPFRPLRILLSNNDGGGRRAYNSEESSNRRAQRQNRHVQLLVQPIFRTSKKYCF